MSDARRRQQQSGEMSCTKRPRSGVDHSISLWSNSLEVIVRRGRLRMLMYRSGAQAFAPEFDPADDVGPNWILPVRGQRAEVQDASRLPKPRGSPPRFGLRQPSGAFASGASGGGRAKPCCQSHPVRGKSGRGLPQSKTLRASRGRVEVRQVLDCASPLAL